MNNMPLPELCRKQARVGHPAVKAFFEEIYDSLSFLGDRSFTELWGQAADHLKEISSADREALKHLGGSLGRYELQHQLGALRTCRNALSFSLEELKQNYPNQKKLGIGLSISAGLMFWIIWA